MDKKSDADILMEVLAESQLNFNNWTYRDLYNLMKSCYNEGVDAATHGDTHFMELDLGDGTEEISGEDLPQETEGHVKRWDGRFA